MVESKFILVTPQMAEQWLETSIGNRCISNVTVESYASDIRRGAWKQNGEAICFDRNGHLREGHHRLKAVIKANTPQMFYVTTGLDPENCTIYDKGKTRTTRDTFALMGLDTWQRSPKIISVVKMWFSTIKKNVKPSDSEVLAFMTRNATSLQFIYSNIFQEAVGGSRPICTKAPISFALFCAFNCGVSNVELMGFMKSLNSGLIDDLNKSSVVVLRNMILNNVFMTNNYETRRNLMKATEMAINDYVARIPWRKTRSNFVAKYSNNKIIQEL